MIVISILPWPILVRIFFGQGNGTFDNQIPYLTELGSCPYSLSVGDFNNDTQLDIVVAYHGIKSIGVLIGYGNEIIMLVLYH
jgi:hypothetical protein